MAKLVRKERNIYYDYSLVDLTQEQLELYKTNKEAFLDTFIYTDKIDFDNGELNNLYIKTTDTEYYLEDEEEPKFDY